MRRFIYGKLCFWVRYMSGRLSVLPLSVDTYAILTGLEKELTLLRLDKSRVKDCFICLILTCTF